MKPGDKWVYLLCAVVLLLLVTGVLSSCGEDRMVCTELHDGVCVEWTRE